MSGAGDLATSLAVLGFVVLALRELEGERRRRVSEAIRRSG